MTHRSRSEFRVGPVGDPDRYVLGEAVGSGAEGILYRGTITTATGVELLVAIKMLQPNLLSRVDEWHARWSEQVELLRSLQVPGVVRVRDGFLGPLPHGVGGAGEATTLYLVMNWVEGEPLDEWVRRRPDRDPLDALKLLIGVAAALDLMHSGAATGGVPVVHRDVKPSNILVSDEGTVLVDFGLTRGLPQGHRVSGVTGTPGYLAPESSQAGVYTAAADRYAFGGVAYFVLTGIEPSSTYEPEAMRASLASLPALAASPDTIAQLMAMLDSDPDARPSSLANWIGQVRRSSLTGLPQILAPRAPGRNPRRVSGAVRAQAGKRPRARLLLPGVAVVVIGLLASVTALDLVGGNDRQGEASGLSTAAGEDPRGPLDPSRVFEAQDPHSSPSGRSLPVTGKWQPVDPGPLSTRGEPKAAWTGKEVLVVGGLLISEYAATTDGAAFNPETGTWRRIPPRPMAGRVLHAVWTGDELVTLGTEGISLDNLTTAAAFNPTTNLWRTIALPPSAQVPQEVVWTGTHVLTWQPEGTSPGALYDPKQDRWTSIPPPPAVASPAGRAVWIGEELAAEGAVLPDNGGPVEQRLLLFNPTRNAWRISTPPPTFIRGWPHMDPIWTGREVVLNSDGGAGTYAYDPQTNTWRTISNPDLSIASGFFRGVQLDNGQVVVRVGNPQQPLQILDPVTGTWSTSGPPPGALPGPDGALVSTGTSVFHWGLTEGDGYAAVQSPNGAWLWTP